MLYRIELIKLKQKRYQSANLIQKYRSMHASGLIVSLVALMSPTGLAINYKVYYYR